MTSYLNEIQVTLEGIRNISNNVATLVNIFL